MDKWGDHALVCQCGGDRTVRHNALRNICFEEAVEAGARPEREKYGLLPARPSSDGLRAARGSSGRRLVDVWLPKGASGKGEALDFAVTSGMRSDQIRRVIDTPEVVFQNYEQVKREHKQTDKV